MPKVICPRCKQQLTTDHECRIGTTRRFFFFGLAGGMAAAAWPWKPDLYMVQAAELAKLPNTTQKLLLEFVDSAGLVRGSFLKVDDHLELHSETVYNKALGRPPEILRLPMSAEAALLIMDWPEPIKLSLNSDRKWTQRIDSVMKGISEGLAKGDI